MALAIDRDRVGVVVDDGEGDAVEISTALRGLSGLGVELLDRHAAANHRLRDFRKIEGRDTRKIVVLNLLETHIIVQLVADRSFGLVHGNGTTRHCWITVGIQIELIARNKIILCEVSDAIGIGSEYPRTRRFHTGLLEGIVVIVIHGVEVLDGELRSLKGGGTLRQVVGFVLRISVVLTDGHAHRVARRHIRHLSGRLLASAHCDLLVGRG